MTIQTPKATFSSDFDHKSGRLKDVPQRARQVQVDLPASPRLKGVFFFKFQHLQLLIPVAGVSEISYCWLPRNRALHRQLPQVGRLLSPVNSPLLQDLQWGFLFPYIGTQLSGLQHLVRPQLLPWRDLQVWPAVSLLTSPSLPAMVLLPWSLKRQGLATSATTWIWLVSSPSVWTSMELLPQAHCPHLVLTMRQIGKDALQDRAVRWNPKYIETNPYNKKNQKLKTCWFRVMVAVL